MLDISYKWNYLICGLLCLASFTHHNVFEVHPWISISFLFRSTSIAWVCDLDLIFKSFKNYYPG